MPVSVTYPLDIEGNLPSNLVTEVHTVTQLNLSMYRIIVPVHAPFYITNFSLKHIGTGGVETILNEASDYAFCLPYEAAARSLERSLYGGVAVVNPALTGSYKVTYQCLGDKWSANRNHVLQALAVSTYNPRQAYWDQLTDVQDTFPPIRHLDDLASMKGMDALIEAFDRLTLAILNKPSPNAVMVGLGNVPNLQLANDIDILSRTRADKFVTLKQVIDLIGH